MIAIFSMFSVVFTTVYSRRFELGMLKSIGMRRKQLTGMVRIEAIAMTLGSALAGIAAGMTMGYVQYFMSAMIEQRPAVFAVDFIVIPAIIIIVVLASVVAATFSSRRIVKQRAVEILRMS